MTTTDSRPIDESVVTPQFMKLNGVEIRHLVNGSWVAWNTKRSEAISYDGSDGWSSTANVKKYCIHPTRESALVSAVNFMAYNGVEMPTPRPTNDIDDLRDYGQ